MKLYLLLFLVILVLAYVEEAKSCSGLNQAKKLDTVQTKLLKSVEGMERRENIKSPDNVSHAKGKNLSKEAQLLKWGFPSITERTPIGEAKEKLREKYNHLKEKVKSKIGETKLGHKAENGIFWYKIYKKIHNMFN
nr:uncharacterized protein LOC106677499 [Halyomorpha halys]